LGAKCPGLSQVSIARPDCLGRLRCFSLLRFRFANVQLLIEINKGVVYIQTH
jgi:hypothetical protein